MVVWVPSGVVSVGLEVGETLVYPALLTHTGYTSSVGIAESGHARPDLANTTDILVR